MPEALYVQDGSYSADEDRQTIALHSTAGISRGLVITAVPGTLNVTVSRGAAVLDSPDGVDSAGRYGAYVQTDTTVLIPQSQTNYPIFITAHPTTGVVSIVTGSVPSNPFLALGSATTSPTTVTSVANTGVRSQPAGAVGGLVNKTGDTMTGPLTVPALTSTGIVAAGGIRNGAAAQPTRRHFAVVTSSDSSTVAKPGLWTRIAVTGAADGGTTDYGAAYTLKPHIKSGVFQAAVDGIYEMAGHVTWIAPIKPGSNPIEHDDIDTEKYMGIALFAKGVDANDAKYATPAQTKAADGTVTNGWQSQFLTDGPLYKGSRITPTTQASTLFQMAAGQYACVVGYQNSPVDIQVGNIRLVFRLVEAT